LADSRTVPPTWEIRLESLAPLNQAGQECWREVCEGIERFLRLAGLDRVEDSSVGSRTEVTANHAEPFAAPDPTT
jgi:hypothetical protein